MKKLLLTTCIIMLFMIFNISGATPAQIAIIPRPKSVQPLNSVLTVDRVLRIFDSSSSGRDFAKFINTAGLKGIDYKCVNSSDLKSEIIIRKDGNRDKYEGYTLTITPEGIEIRSDNYAGTLYAIQTLKQILVQTWERKGFTIPCMIIKDEPAFGYRGFLLDASRHFQPVSTVKHVLDYMLSMKLNVFHWHLTDDQGWRIQSLRYPELNTTGSFMDKNNQPETNGFYSVDEIRDIIAYASERNIEIIPEIEIPGHALAVMTVFPQLRCPHRPGSNAFCAGNPETYTVIKEIFGEAIDIFKPKHIHIGGDEREKDLWNKCDLCLAKMKEEGVANENDLQNRMLIGISDFIHSKGVTTISWAENIEGGMAKGQIIQSWRLRDEAFKAVKQGHYVINSDNGECYFDYPANIVEAKNKPDWMPVLPADKVYNFNPVPKGLSKEEEKMILGSECPLWTEVITIDKIFPQIKDRLEAHAEKCWTPAEMKNYSDFTGRLQILSGYFRFQFYGEIPDML